MMRSTMRYKQSLNGSFRESSIISHLHIGSLFQPIHQHRDLAITSFFGFPSTFSWCTPLQDLTRSTPTNTSMIDLLVEEALFENDDNTLRLSRHLMGTTLFWRLSQGPSWIGFYLLDNLDSDILVEGYLSMAFFASLGVKDHERSSSFSNILDIISHLVVILFFTFTMRETRWLTHLHLKDEISTFIQSMVLLIYHDNFELLYKQTDIDFLVLKDVSLILTCSFCIEKYLEMVGVVANIESIIELLWIDCIYLYIIIDDQLDLYGIIDDLLGDIFLSLVRS